MSFSVGYGNGLFREDGGLGDQYNNSGTIARGLFLAGRLVMHPSANGYTGNVRDISRGVVLRSRITELSREHRRLRAEIVSRERRIRRLESQLAGARESEIGQLERRRAQLETEVQAERDAIRRATERLRQLEQGGATRPPAQPTPPPGTKPPEP
jgi:uncharacterized coiled-coil protein SlyX